MPNGKPGDHPLTDIVHYGSSSYPDEINELVREMAKHPRFEFIRDRVADILWEDWPSWQNVRPDFAKVRSSLESLRTEMERAG